MITGLLLLSLILMCGGGPSGEVLGFKYWEDPGATKAYIVDGEAGRFTAFLYVLIFSGFAFYFGPELIVFTAGEMRNPRKNLPIAARRFFYRLVTFYVLGALAIGIICNSNAEGLTSGSGNADASPWVIAIRDSGIAVLDSVVNAGILTSAWSSGAHIEQRSKRGELWLTNHSLLGNSFLFMSSRSLYSLAISGNAPQIFVKCNGYGLPIYAVGAACLFVPLAYLSLGSSAGTVFNYFISITNTAGFLSWTVCCITMLRFRKACDTQNVQVPYRSRFQPILSRICIGCFVSLLLLNGFTNFYTGNWSVSGFVTAYIGLPAFLLLWIGHKLIAGRSDPWMTPPAEIDLESKRAEVEADAQLWAAMDAKKAEMRGGKGPTWLKKVSVLWA